jgi:hypothetical protein
MNNLEMMITKEIIEVGLALIGLIVSFVAIWQSHKSIKLTEQSIRDANRPYIGISIESIDTVYLEKFIVFKNYGNSSAKLTSLEFKSETSNIAFIKNNMQSLVGGTIMPGQKFTSTIDDNFKELIKIEICYEGPDKVSYSEVFDIKTDMSSDLLWMKKTLSSDDKVSTAIKLGAQSIAKTLK